jgi:hypothetical protein
MALTCSVCTSQRAPEINRDLLGSATVRDVAGRYGVSKSAVDRHRRHCLAPKMAAAIARREDIDEERLTSYANGLLEAAVWGMVKARQDEDPFQHRAYLGEARKCIETLAKLNGIGRAEVAVHVDARRQLAVLSSMTEQELRALAARGAPVFELPAGKPTEVEAV